MTFQRSNRVAEAIKVEVGMILLHGLKDIRVPSERVSVTNVEVTRDLRHATVHVSVYGDEEIQDTALQGLKSAAGFVRSELGKVMSLRSTPEVHFKLDHSIEHGANIAALLNRIAAERQASEAKASDDDASQPHHD